MLDQLSITLQAPFVSVLLVRQTHEHFHSGATAIRPSQLHRAGASLTGTMLCLCATAQQHANEFAKACSLI